MNDQPTVKSVDRLLLSAESVARILDVSPAVAYALIRDGRLPSVQIEGTSRRHVPWSSLQAWIRQLIKTQIAETPEKS